MDRSWAAIMGGFSGCGAAKLNSLKRIGFSTVADYHASRFKRRMLARVLSDEAGPGEAGPG